MLYTVERTNPPIREVIYNISYRMKLLAEGHVIRTQALLIKELNSKASLS